MANTELLIQVQLAEDGTWETFKKFEKQYPVISTVEKSFLYTNAHEVEYEPRSITVEEYNAMGVTAEEEMSIYDQIYPQLDKDTFGV